MSEYFVASSWTDPQNFFSGVAFTSDSAVIGAQGAQLYRERHGHDVPAFEDGVYVCCSETPEGLKVATDAMGLMPLFLYRRDTEWAVSNSFLLLAEFLKESGKNLKIDWLSLRGFTAGNHMTLMSFRTPLQSIELVPAGACLWLEKNHVTVEMPPQNTQATYADLLREGIEKWLGILSALRNDDRFDLTVDVTGGLDTRTTLAFALTDLVDARTPARFLTLSGPESQSGTDEDVRIAKLIAQEFGFNIVHESHPKKSYHKADTVYRKWALASLGHYSQIAPPIETRDPFYFRLSGLAGELLRPGYGGDNPDAVVASRVSLFGARFSRTKKKAGVLVRSVLDSIASSGVQEDQISTEYFRQLRGRLHASVISRLAQRLSPLSSLAFFEATRRLPLSDQKNNQIYFDIVRNLCPKLLEIPFDRPEKEPRAVTIKNFTALPDLKPADIHIYAAAPPPEGAPENPLQDFRADFIDRICRLPLPDAAFNLSTSQFRRVLRYRKMKGAPHIRFGRLIETGPLHAAALLAELRRLTR